MFSLTYTPCVVLGPKIATFMSVASRMNLSQAVAFGATSAADAENRAGFRSLGRYHRIRVEPSGNWTTAIGVEAEVQPAGMR